MTERGLRGAPRALLLGLALAASGIVAGELLGRLVGSTLVRATGEAVRALLAALGVPSTLRGAILASPGGFAYEITPACLGLGPAAVVAAIAIARTRGAARRAGLALAGVVVLLAANLLRLAGLFRLGCALPERFDLFHLGLGQAWMVVAMAAFLLPILREAPARTPAETPR